MQLMSDAGVTHVSYVLILYSVSFLLFLFVNLLLRLYAVHAWPAATKTPDPRSSSMSYPRNKRHSSTPGMNGSANGHARRPSEAQRVRDAEAFELEGLMSEEDGEGLSPKEDIPSASLS